MNKADKYMYDLLNNILKNGYRDINPRPQYKDGTPAYTYSVNGNFRSYDIGAGEFPICTLRPIAIKSAIKEMFWIYQRGSNDLKTLNDDFNVTYWNDWESKDVPGTIGHRYGYIVSKYHLMENLLKELMEDPYGRRHIIDLYQYTELNATDGLYPCAFLTIWNVRNDGNGNEYLDLHLIQRSGDSLAASCAGVNECQYAALLMMIARHCGYKVGMLYHLVANEQIYSKHVEQAKEMVRRYDEKYELEKHGECQQNPNLILNTDKTNFYDFTIDDFQLVNYNPVRPQLKFELGI